MAFSGVHISCGKVNEIGGASIGGKLDWSETMTSAGVTTNKCPGRQGEHTFEITASFDIWFACGPNPDASAGPRYLLQATASPRNVYVDPGDKLAWIAA